MDLTGGIEREREYVFAERPDDPEMRDSASFWVVDGGARWRCREWGSRRWRPTGRPTGCR